MTDYRTASASAPALTVPTAWQSVPAFIRFVVWLGAIGAIIGMIVGAIFGVVAAAAIG